MKIDGGKGLTYTTQKVVYEELRALIAHAQFCEGVKWRRLALLDLHKVALNPAWRCTNTSHV